MAAYGDFIYTDGDLEQCVDLLAMQMKETFRQLYPDGKLPNGTLGASLGWKLRELTEEDRAIAEAWLEENEQLA